MVYHASLHCGVQVSLHCGVQVSLHCGVQVSLHGNCRSIIKCAYCDACHQHPEEGSTNSKRAFEVASSGGGIVIPVTCCQTSLKHTSLKIPH